MCMIASIVRDIDRQALVTIVFYAMKRKQKISGLIAAKFHLLL